MIRKITFCTLCAVVAAGCATDYDVIIRGGTVYDGSGGNGVVVDVGIVDDTIAVSATSRRHRLGSTSMPRALRFRPVSSTC